MGGKARPRYLIPTIVGIVAFILYMGLEWWATARVYNTGFMPDVRKETWIASHLVTYGFEFVSQSFVALALVVAGRRRSFYLPQLIVGLSDLLMLSIAMAQGAQGLSVFFIILMPLVVFLPLAPAVALVRTDPCRREPPRLDRGAWNYLAVLFIAVILIQELQSPPYFGDGRMLYGIAYVLIALLFTGSLFVFGAGLGTRRPLWPWALAIPSIISILGQWTSELVRGEDFFGTGQFVYLLRWQILPTLVIVYAAATWEPFLRYFRGWKYRCAPGEEVVLRERWEGGIWAARPAVVVMDKRSEKRFLVPTGVKWWYPTDDDGNEMRLPLEDWRLEEGEMNTRNILSFAWPHRPYSVFIAWDPDWNFTGYYVNLQTPLERTKFGFDYKDHVLDIEMSADKSSWTWKDEEDLAHMVEEGLFTEEQADDFRAWGETAVEHIRFETPFDEDWSEWRPDSEWLLPELDEDWDELD